MWIIFFLLLVRATYSLPDIPVGSCERFDVTAWRCRGGADWYHIVIPEHSRTVGVAVD
jgi:hypothetical protein